MSIDNLQFYPTPLDLAKKAWGMFKNKHFLRVLEPSAGEGHLARVDMQVEYEGRFYSRSRITVDCLEIDLSKHHILRQKGMDVIGLDFMQFNQGAIYSHILMNPPFSQGVQHVLHAWDILYDGELVAIINAESIRNPFSKERSMLVSLIGKYGYVEFAQEAFIEAERRTEVEVALVYLRKESNVAEDIYGDILNNLKKDKTTAEGLVDDYQEINAVVLPRSFVENQVAAFTAATVAAKEAIFAQQRAKYYASILGNTMERLETGFGLNKPDAIKEIAEAFHGEYRELKNRAWTSILRSTAVTSKLSSKAQKRLESEFETIKLLDFNVVNIFAFLSGLVEKKGEIQIDMACDIFDSIVKYHSENTVFTLGWKSNDKHRTCGMKIKTTRFILPNNGTYSKSLNWDSEQRLADIDKVFAMLDGKAAPEVSLVSIFNDKFDALRSGERVDASYFQCRFYPGIGTIHFFAKDKKLVDRLNRLVGRHRQWLPPEGEKVNEAFWVQYDGAEKFDKEVRAELKTMSRYSFDDPLMGIMSMHDDVFEPANKKACDAISKVLERRGINVIEALSRENILMLEAS